jgi:hypothetical protein
MLRSRRHLEVPNGATLIGLVVVAVLLLLLRVVVVLAVIMLLLLHHRDIYVLIHHLGCCQDYRRRLIRGRMNWSAVVGFLTETSTYV